MSYISQTKINKCSGAQFDLADDHLTDTDLRNYEDKIKNLKKSK